MVNLNVRVNSISVSATPQHIEAVISANNIHPNNQSRFCCQACFLTGIGISGRFEYSLPIASTNSEILTGQSAVYLSKFFQENQHSRRSRNQTAFFV